MIIKKLVIKNYKCFEDAKIKFHEGRNILVGGNNTGKSTILEALTIALTGKIDDRYISQVLTPDLFNIETRSRYLADLQNNPDVALPEIIIEVYFDDVDADYRGTNNSLGEDSEGIRVKIALNPELKAVYNETLADGKVWDIPTDFYTVSCNYFSARPVNYKSLKIKGRFIDASRRDYAYYSDKFVKDTLSSLPLRQNAKIGNTYRNMLKGFNASIANAKNSSIETIGGFDLSVGTSSPLPRDWQEVSSLMVNNSPFDWQGFGFQNMIKIELAIDAKSRDQLSYIIIEEPESNLSPSNMARLLSFLDEKADGQQIFIATHSSFIANKLDLNNIILVNEAHVENFSNLKNDTNNFFKRASGYDTLRLILADKPILVEGPTEELLFQKYYLDTYGKAPISDGFDIIALNSLSFKRYFDLAIAAHKNIVAVTDNDGDVAKNITKKYKDYVDCDNIAIISEEDESLNTIEPAFIHANEGNLARLSGVLFKGDSSKNREDIQKYMSNNKTEWALKVFESDEKFEYPQPIKDAFEKYR